MCGTYYGSFVDFFFRASDKESAHTAGLVENVRVVCAACLYSDSFAHAQMVVMTNFTMREYFCKDLADT